MDFAGQAAAIGLVAHDAVDLGGDDDGFAAGVGFQESPENAFAVTARINIGSVKKIDPKFEGLAQEGLAFLFAKGPGVAAGFEFACGRRAIGHAAETYAGNFEAGLTEIDVVHYFPLAKNADCIRVTYPDTTGCGRVGDGTKPPARWTLRV